MNLLCALLGAFGLTLAGCGGGPSPAVTIPDMGAFLATSRCADGRIAALAGCAGRPQRASDPMLYRRADASGHADGQIEDAFVSDDGRYHVNGWSYPPHGPFDALRGDGGDVAVVDGDLARIDYTQNGTAGGGTIAGYWAGPGCVGGTGWLLFDRYAPTGSWRSRVAYLAGSATRGTCPRLDAAFTRWRLETVPFTMSRSVTLPVIVSEHYAGPSIAGSAEMERFVLARGVGRVAWESWATRAPVTPVSWACRGIEPWNGPPATGWQLQDRRCLTAVVPGSTMTGARWGWPGSGFVP